MKVTLPDLPNFERLRFTVEPPLTDEGFEKLCRLNSELKRIERTREGEIEVMSPTGGETGDGNSELNAQVRAWWKTHRRGRVYDSATGFHLRDGSIMSPDACWVSTERLTGVSKRDRQGFMHVCPNFVIELRSPSDRLAEVQRKVEHWLENGAELGWILDPTRRSALVYESPGKPREDESARLRGTGPVAGFELDLLEVWECYDRP